MSTHEFVDGAAVILLVMAVAAGLEALVPLFARPARQPGRLATNLWLMVTTLGLNWGLASAAALIALALPQQGLLGSGGLPPAAQLLISIAVLDFFFGYLAHRALHAIPALWRVHRVHHGDPFVDVTTTYRTHPLEVAWRFLFMIIPVWALGIDAGAVVLYRVLSAINGMLEHANLRVWQPLDSLVSFLWVTPNMHKVHHSRLSAETDTNYGNLFSLADQLLGTFTPSERAAGVRYGLDDEGPAPVESLSRLLVLPFAAQREPTSEMRVPPMAGGGALDAR